MDEQEYEEEADINEQTFHNNVREQIIFLLLFLILYLASFALLKRFRRSGREDYYSTDEDEVTVYRISTWLCTFSLATSIGAVLLLPFSIVANEVLVNYPNSYYIKWLNSSLIQGLWNYVFLFSNVSIFILLPFAYLFTESEGFFGHRKGLLARVYETFVVLVLSAVVVLGMTYIIAAVIDEEQSNVHTVLSLRSYYLPFLYSCISFLGVLILLDKQRRTSPLRRNLVYPVAMLLLIGLTVIAVLLVVQNTLSLLIGIKALPSSSEQFTLGVSSLSKLGPFGAAMEIVLIIYLIVTSSIGLYTAPCVRLMRPIKMGTSFTLVIANCALLLIISSALPVLSKILGITNFDLLGDFGSIEWLGNMQIVLLYNILFATASSLCVVNKFTAKVRNELYARLVENYIFLTNCVSYLN